MDTLPARSPVVNSASHRARGDKRAPVNALPPHDADAERNALACILDCDQTQAAQYFSQLSERHFYDEQAREIFRGLTQIEADGALFNAVELTERLKAGGRLDDVGGIVAIENLEVPSAANFPSYLAILDDRAARREAIQLHEREISEARNLQRPFQPAAKPSPAKRLGDLKRRTADDPNELLRTGYLCRSGGLLLAAPTGIGKSSFAIQSQIMFALGRPMFGITPARPLRSLYVQAENDEGDLAEMRDGVIAGLDLSPGDLETVFANVITAQENARTGRAFFDCTVAPLLELHKPDLLWIDPALSFIGGEASSQKDVGAFLRNLLNPLLSRYNCGGVVIHHTNKPGKGEEKSAWQAGDFAYLGSGSVEWANWARAVLAIRSLGSHEVFELRAGKRGSRIGWKDEDGKPGFARIIGHANEPGVICWREASEDETPKGKSKRVGKPDDLTALVPLEKPIAKALLIDKWKDLYGNHAKGRAFLDSLIADGKLYEWRHVRPGTNAAKLIARKPQPAE